MCLHRGSPATAWTRQARHLADLCSPPAGSTESKKRPAQRSTQWNPKRLRESARPANVSELEPLGCTCAEATFVQFLAQACPVGIYSVTRSTAMTVDTALRAFRHESKLTLLTLLRTADIQEEDVYRGVISQDSPDTFRVATNLPSSQGTVTTSGAWRHTDKHRAAFLIPSLKVAQLRFDSTSCKLATPDQYLNQGAMVLLASAPVSYTHVTHPHN